LSDGRVLLTDQPVRGATTERSWQLPVDDPAVARQRAADVSAEAERVSERIQRMIEQDRRADEERERTRLARLAIERDRQRDEEPYYVASVVPYGHYGFAHRRGHGHRGMFGRGDRPQPTPHPGVRPPMLGR
jgi:hypothetical protein